MKSKRIWEVNVKGGASLYINGFISYFSVITARFSKQFPSKKHNDNYNYAYIMISTVTCSLQLRHRPLKKVLKRCSFVTWPDGPNTASLSSSLGSAFAQH